MSAGVRNAAGTGESQRASVGAALRHGFVSSQAWAPAASERSRLGKTVQHVNGRGAPPSGSADASCDGPFARIRAQAIPPRLRTISIASSSDCS